MQLGVISIVQHCAHSFFDFAVAKFPRLNVELLEAKTKQKQQTMGHFFH